LTHLQRGERSERELGAALAAAESLGMRPLAARCHLTLGELYLRMGRREQAASEYSAAVEICRAADMPFWLGQAERGLEEGLRAGNAGPLMPQK
jgi:tetratricopeptide (TPR) repeat protein